MPHLRLLCELLMADPTPSLLPSMLSKLMRAGVSGVAVVVLLSACSKSNQAAPGAGAPIAQVGVLTVKAQPVILKRELPGRATAYAIAEVRPQVGGILKRRVFREGADVKAGEVLYEIDPSLYQAAASNARAALAKADANLVSIKLKAQRYAELVKSGVIAKQDNDDVVASLGQAEADVTAAKAALQTADINQSYTRITAPISGRIGKSEVTAGALLTANQATAVATIQQLDPIYVDVTETSGEMMRLRREFLEGSLRTANGSVRTDRGHIKVNLLLEDGTKYELPGKLQFADVTVDENTSSVTVRAEFPNPKHEILPGMYVRAVIEAGMQQNAVLVPQQAVTHDPTGAALVLVLTPEGIVEQRHLNVDRVVDNQWVVRDGLQDGEQVIVEGAQKVKVGDKAKAADAAPATPAAPAAAAK
jgi:membrane fusion protein, multidrug efflux system